MKYPTLLTVCGLGLALALTGCGGSSTSDSQSASTQTKSQPTTGGGASVQLCDALVGQPVGSYKPGDKMHLADWKECSAGDGLSFPNPQSAGCYNQASAYQGQWFFVQDQDQNFIFGKPGGVWQKTSKPSQTYMRKQIGC